MKNLKIKQLKGAWVIGLFNEFHPDFYLMDSGSEKNKKGINFYKMADTCESLEEFKEKLQNLIIKREVHSTYFKDYFEDVEEYESHVEWAIENEELSIFNVIKTESISYNVELIDESENSFFSECTENDIQNGAEWDADIIESYIHEAVEYQLEMTETALNWLNDYNSLIQAAEDDKIQTVEELAELIVLRNDQDLIRGIYWTNKNDLYLKEEEQAEYDQLQEYIKKHEEMKKLREELSKNKLNSNKKRIKI